MLPHDPARKVSHIRFNPLGNHILIAGIDLDKECSIFLEYYQISQEGTCLIPIMEYVIQGTGDQLFGVTIDLLGSYASYFGEGFFGVVSLNKGKSLWDKNDLPYSTTTWASAINNSSTVIAASHDRGLCLYDLHRGELLQYIEDERFAAAQAVFAKKDNQLLTAKYTCIRVLEYDDVRACDLSPEL